VYVVLRVTRRARARAAALIFAPHDARSSVVIGSSYNSTGVSAAGLDTSTDSPQL